MSLRAYLKLPEAERITDLDSPEATIIHAAIIRKKPFLKNIYRDFYAELQRSLKHKTADASIVEIGSGGGFIKETFPQAVTTDILELPWIDVRCSGNRLPFKSASVDAFFMINVLHHIPDPKAFLKDVGRCLKPGGKVVMIEPANTAWGRFIYTRFHHEPFDPAGDWAVPAGRPLTAANGALPWIIFERDRRLFELAFPEFAVRRVRYHTPFRYLISGGVSMRQLLPTITYPLVAAIEAIFSPLGRMLGMFMTVEIEKK